MNKIEKLHESIRTLFRTEGEKFCYTPGEIERLVCSLNYKRLYLIFFKSQDADAMTAAFKEYTEQIVNKKSRPSILAKLEQFKALIQSAVVDRTKKKELER